MGLGLGLGGAAGPPGLTLRLKPLPPCVSARCVAHLGDVGEIWGRCRGGIGEM